MSGCYLAIQSNCYEDKFSLLRLQPCPILSLKDKGDVLENPGKRHVVMQPLLLTSSERRTKTMKSPDSIFSSYLGLWLFNHSMTHAQEAHALNLN